jgi:hypothetical protein
MTRSCRRTYHGEILRSLLVLSAPESSLERGEWVTATLVGSNTDASQMIHHWTPGDLPAFFLAIPRVSVAV